MLVTALRDRTVCDRLSCVRRGHMVVSIDESPGRPLEFQINALHEWSLVLMAGMPRTDHVFHPLKPQNWLAAKSTTTIRTIVVKFNLIDGTY